jgi:hypothetical protein
MALSCRSGVSAHLSLLGGKADLEEAPLNSSIYEYALERFELRARDYEWQSRARRNSRTIV